MRISSLTGLRGIAAVAVLLYHIPHNPAFAQFAIPLFSRAYLAVDLFFILSGFVISFGYHDRVVKHLGAKSYTDFLFNRMARVWPLHLIVTLVFAARIILNVSGNQSIELTPANIFTNLTMVQSWGWGTQPIAGNSWSVSTELAAYLLYPLIALIAFSRWALAQAAACIGLLLLVATSGFGSSGPMDVNNSDSVLTLLRCLAGFSLGVLTYRCADQSWCRRILDRTGGFAITCVLIAAALLLPGADVLVVCLMPALVLSCYYDGSAARAVMANPVSFHLGLISYSIYLWHPLVRDVAARAMTMAHRHGVTGMDWLFIAGMLVATWLLCWASYLLVEVRGHQLIKWLQSGRPRRPSVVEATAP
ncbi:acyltransferase family protein [Sphingobium vermicomposti]|uniref:Peptidoglycan/LPS O-acetylase OafA/YrhL n=1 Tax=Sphingobium vermicomposti TaxID=529005 RepID=A0A846M6D8_9SPHN|nr:acyltransferase [Sphingobium vermicomposti]NIJ16201.1 peptidoglycan/LPS O-acetylase OafA/YrhL [Sphingobium vermicomposti]